MNFQQRQQYKEFPAEIHAVIPYIDVAGVAKNYARDRANNYLPWIEVDNVEMDINWDKVRQSSTAWMFGSTDEEYSDNTDHRLFFENCTQQVRTFSEELVLEGSLTTDVFITKTPVLDEDLKLLKSELKLNIPNRKSLKPIQVHSADVQCVHEVRPVTRRVCVTVDPKSSAEVILKKQICKTRHIFHRILTLSGPLEICVRTKADSFTGTRKIFSVTVDIQHLLDRKVMLGDVTECDVMLYQDGYSITTETMPLVPVVTSSSDL